MADKWLENKDGITYFQGEDVVVHLTGDGRRLQFKLKHLTSPFGKVYHKAKYMKQDFLDVSGNRYAKKDNSLDSRYRPLAPEEIKRRALSRVEEIGYNILWKNCEHFVNWCRYDKETSHQANVLAGALTTIVIAGVLVVLCKHKSPILRLLSRIVRFCSLA